MLSHLAQRGVTPLLAAQMIGESAGDPRGGMKVVLGSPRMRRDRVQRLADALDDPFLDQILADQLWFSRIREILPVRRTRTFDVEVADLHNLVAEDVVVHNCAPPFRSAEFDILYGNGISREGSLIDMGVEQGIVRKSGAWYTYEGDQLGQGKENARNFLRDNADLANEIEKRIKEKLGVGPASTPTPAPPTATPAMAAAPTATRPGTAPRRPGPPPRPGCHGLARDRQRPGFRVRGRDVRGHGPGTQDPEARARQICLRLLTTAPRTRAQLAQAMHRGGVPAEAAEAILARFTDAGLIYDAAFARAWVESRHHSRGLSKRVSVRRVRRYGVQNEEIRAAVDALDPEQEVDTARLLVERKLASTRGRPPETRARQAASMLARKGYPPALAFRLIREAMQQEGAELDEMDADQYLDPDAEDAALPRDVGL